MKLAHINNYLLTKININFWEDLSKSSKSENTITLKMFFNILKEEILENDIALCLFAIATQQNRKTLVIVW